jgi:diguanylate cyclase (GGDEF)-like protein
MTPHSDAPPNLESHRSNSSLPPSDRTGPIRTLAREPRNILIVDDDEDFLDLILPLLRSRGHEVTVARSGASARRMIDRSEFDIVVVDGVLPDTDGIAWITDLRRSDHETAIVFMSGFPAMVTSMKEARSELDVALVVDKPLEPAAFCRRLERCPTCEPLSMPRPSLPSLPQADDGIFAAVRADYMRTLPAKLQDLSERVRGAKRRTDVFLLREIRERAHKLRGTAGSYGFEDVGKAAGVIEEVLRQADASGIAVPAWDEIDRALSKASAVTERVVGESVHRPMPVGVAGARILVVDGDPMLLAAIEDIAREQLVEIVPATAGDVLQRVRISAPDAVIAVLGPASIADAPRLYGALRELPGQARIPIGFVCDPDAVAERLVMSKLERSVHISPSMDSEGLCLAVRQLLSMAESIAQSALVVSSSLAWVSRVRTLLARDGHSIVALPDAARIMRVLAGSRPDVVLLDVDEQGADICRLLRCDPEWQSVPIILLGRDGDTEHRLQALRAGADDLVSESASDDEILTRVRARIDRMRLLSERFDKDALTDLPLRRPFLERLGRSMAECRRHGRPLTLGLIDVDLFKAINDRHGHQCADRALATLGRLLSSRFRAEDLRGRWGGEEFVVAFPGESSEALFGALGNALKALGTLPFRGKNDEIFHVSFSAGVASYPEDGASTRALLDVADRRLYQAKRAGRARIVSED